MKMSNVAFRVAAMVVAVSAMAHRAHALIYVKYFTNSPSCQSGCISPYQAGSPITINLTSDIWLIYVYSTIGTEDIGRITLTGTGANLVSLVIGQDGSPTAAPLRARSQARTGQVSKIPEGQMCASTGGSAAI